MSTKEKGDAGEALAALELIKKGYKIRERNFRTKLGEIDIIAEKDGYIVFVEVKLRKNLLGGFPKEAVTKQKKRRILSAALEYAEKNALLSSDMRFDVIEILMGEKILFNHIEDAFWIDGLEE